MGFTNGNYYLAHILEIALVSVESSNAFHIHFKIHYSILRRVQELTNISNKTIRSLGLFLGYEQAQSETNHIIIAQVEFLNDSLILLANCINHSYVDYSIFTKCKYVDNMLVFRNKGYKKPGQYMYVCIFLLSFRFTCSQVV